jgi:hypothetical protein
VSGDKAARRGGLSAVVSSDEFIFPVPIRNGETIVRVLMPKNLTPDEAKRIGAVLLAFAENPVTDTKD